MNEADEYLAMIDEARATMRGPECFADLVEVVGESVLAIRRLPIRWATVAGSHTLERLAKAWLVYRELPADRPRPKKFRQLELLGRVPPGDVGSVWSDFLAKSPDQTVAGLRQFLAGYPKETHPHYTFRRKRVKRPPRNVCPLFEVMDLPPSHMTDEELAACDEFIATETRKIREAWSPQREAAARGVDMRYKQHKHERAVNVAGQWHDPLPLPVVSTAFFDDDEGFGSFPDWGHD